MQRIDAKVSAPLRVRNRRKRDYIAVRQRLRVVGAVERFVILPKRRYSAMADTASIVIGPLSAAQYAQVSSRLALPALTPVGVPGICNGASRLHGGAQRIDAGPRGFERSSPAN